MYYNLERMKTLFTAAFGPSDEKIRFFAAPGRINLIGEHIDYCGGFVFPAALTLDTLLAIRPNRSRQLRMTATDLDEIYTADLDDLEKARGLKWGNYQAGVAKELMAMGYVLTGADLLFYGTIPYGSGLSSSASIELATGLALSALAENSMQRGIDPMHLALAGQRAENQFCGVKCGIMDQFASAMGKQNHAILLDCATLMYEYVPLQLGEYVLILANTCKKHALGDSKYNERRAEVEEGLRILRQISPETAKPNLCGYTLKEYQEMEPQITDSVIRRRVRHIITENERVKQAVAVLRRGDLAAFGALLREANDSIRYLYEVTGSELDAMYDAALPFSDCIGSRMTGGGFGGCTINIVKRSAADAFIETVGNSYYSKTGITPQFYICSIGDGAREIK